MRMSPSLPHRCYRALMSNFRSALDELLRPLDATLHADALKALRRCRRTTDLADLASDGWLDSEVDGKRRKLIKHGSGTFLVVEYEDGWSKRLSMALFR
ncbi:MAG: hypothetical protein ACI9MC_000520 [Kiritimatiellia bacterium]|jgi:hypothetical protein